MDTKMKEAIQALNRIDDLASITAQDNHEGEAEKLAEDYALVFKYITESHKAIVVPYSEQDAQDMVNGETFNWTFDGVDVKLRPEIEKDNC